MTETENNVVIEAKDELIKKCKKCGKTLRSDSKYKMCENCRRERSEKVKSGFKAAGEVALGVGVTVLGVLGLKKK